MNRVFRRLSLASAITAGCGITCLVNEVSFIGKAWAAENITAQVIHTTDLNGDALGPASATGLRSKSEMTAEGATISIQDGNVPKHMHPNTNEIQYILEGTGTIWLGDKEVQVKPGDLVIIPKGTAHGGTKPNGRTIKAIAIKTPPQAPDDTKMLD